LGRKVAEIAVQGAFCDRIEEFGDEEEAVEVTWQRYRG